MKKLLFALLLALMSLAVLSCASASMLPTPPPVATPVPAPTTGTPIPVPDPEPAGPLPSLSNVLGFAGDRYDYYYTDESGIVFNALIYPTKNLNNAISAYLKSCEGRGYAWTVTDKFIGYTAYKISGGGYTAYFVPNYGENALILLQSGMQAEPEIAPPEPYEMDKLLLTVNGKSYQLDYNPELRFTTYDREERHVIYKNNYNDPFPSNSIFPSDVVIINSYEYGWEGAALAGKCFVFTSDTAPFQCVGVTLPDDAFTARTYTMTKDKLNDLSFILYGMYPDQRLVNVCSYPDSASNTALPTIPFYNPYIRASATSAPNTALGLNSGADYFAITQVYQDGQVYQCKFEATFNNGELVISGTFCVNAVYY